MILSGLEHQSYCFPGQQEFSRKLLRPETLADCSCCKAPIVPFGIFTTLDPWITPPFNATHTHTVKRVRSFMFGQLQQVKHFIVDHILPFKGAKQIVCVHTSIFIYSIYIHISSIHICGVSCCVHRRILADRPNGKEAKWTKYVAWLEIYMVYVMWCLHPSDGESKDNEYRNSDFQFMNLWIDDHPQE